MNPKIKEHLISAGITFATVFFLALGASFESLSVADLRQEVVVAIFIAAARSAVREVVYSVIYRVK